MYLCACTRSSPHTCQLSQGSGSCRHSAKRGHSHSNPPVDPGPYPHPVVSDSQPSPWLPSTLVSKGLPIIFVCFCFVLFPSLPLYSVLWETPKDYSQPPRKTARTGHSGHLGLLTPQLALVCGGREGLLIYLFIYPSCPAPHPASCRSPLGKMKNSLRQQQTRQTTWPPQFNFL